MPDIIWGYIISEKRLITLEGVPERSVAFYAGDEKYLKNYIFFYASPIPQPAEQEH